jgi:hypothetical protein
MKNRFSKEFEERLSWDAESIAQLEILNPPPSHIGHTGKKKRAPRRTPPLSLLRNDSYWQVVVLP